jgi:hypothetical protein
MKYIHHPYHLLLAEEGHLPLVPSLRRRGDGEVEFQNSFVEFPYT